VPEALFDEPAPEPARAAKPPRFTLSVEAGHEQAFDDLLALARRHEASDVHVLAARAPNLRIGGELVPVGQPLDEQLVERMLLARVPERVRPDLDKHGSCDFAFNHPQHGRFRANVTRQRTGLKLTARPIRADVPTLEELGLPDSIASATHHHQGLIVVTGASGHGKTTTLAAIVDIINRERTDHIITVEDPIEYIHPRKRAMISQREVGTHTKTFAAALKGSLREDPDVIVVGELRDTETVRMALSASETGHLVISTMNTPNAAKTIERLIDLFPPGDQPQVRMSLAGGLRLIISQRLVPSTDRSTVHAAAELLPGTPPLWALIRDGKTFQIPSLQQRGKALGIVRLDDSLVELVKQGKTTLETAREFAEAPDQFEALLSGRPARPFEPGPQQQGFNAGEAGQMAQKLGKDVLSKAGRLFGGDKK
jgi:twitching motility protein PilT